MAGIMVGGKSLVDAIARRIIPSVSSNECLGLISAEERQRYDNKLQVLATCDPFKVSAALFLLLKIAKPMVEFHFTDYDMYI